MCLLGEENDEERYLMSGMLIHAADFSGNAKPFALSRRWSELVNKEFAAQVGVFCLI